MLSSLDIMTGKIIVQLQLANADDVREELRKLDKGAGDQNRDLINRLTDRGKLGPKDIELVRHRAALYEHVRSEAAYLRLLERHTSTPKTEVARLIADTERHAFRRRLGEMLVREGKLTKEQDRSLVQRMRQQMEKDDAAIIDRYRREDFAGVAKPLIPGRRLEPADFKISTLFRSKETRALVDKAELEALRAAAVAETAVLAEAGGEKHDHHHGAKREPRPDSSDEAPAGPVPGRMDKLDKLGDRPGIDQLRAMRKIGDYQIVELLGAGGMGAVFLGQKAGAYEYVAIKVMIEQAANEQERGRFEREITLTRRIQHKNVIGILDAGKTKTGLTFLVVPALAGKELRAHIEQAREGLDPVFACATFEQVLEGLQAVHDSRIVHRDMKPENVFVLAGSHDVKIMDFGLAKLDDEADKESSQAFFRSMSGEIVGSPSYIAPESITCDPIDRRTDIYSAGVMFFEMLTGKRPIDSETAQGYLTAHLVAPPLTLAEARPDRRWAPEAESLLSRMLGKTRDERPESCKAILAELRGGVRDKIIQAGAPIPPTATGEPVAAAPEKKFAAKGLLGRLWGNS